MSHLCLVVLPNKNASMSEPDAPLFSCLEGSSRALLLSCFHPVSLVCDLSTPMACSLTPSPLAPDLLCLLPKILASNLLRPFDAKNTPEALVHKYLELVQHDFGDPAHL